MEERIIKDINDLLAQLFQKMKEVGYEWDAEKKELKKIELIIEEFNDEDYGIDGLWHAQHILEKTLGTVDGYETDDGMLEHQCAISAVKKLREQKSAKIGEPNPETLDKAIDLYYFTYGNGKGGFDYLSFDNFKDIVKTFVEDYQPKPTWSEDDELFLLSTIQSLELTNGAAQMKIDWLKSLKERLKEE